MSGLNVFNQASFIMTHIISSVILAVLFMIHTTDAFSQSKSLTIIGDKNLEWLKVHKNSDFIVRISDQVTDGCWTNSEATKIAVELELKRSGFNVVKEIELKTIAFELSSVGYSVGNTNLCIVNYNFNANAIMENIYVLSGHEISSFNYGSFWERRGILSGPKQSMSDQIKTAYVETMQAFLIDIDEKQDSLFREIYKRSNSSEAKEFWGQFLN